MLKPEEGGMFAPHDHPDRQISLDDYRRGLNQMVHICRNDPPELDAQTRVQHSVAAMQKVGFNADALIHMLAWTIVELATP
jgi:hypothetical protein